VGDVITNVERLEGGWWRGRLRGEVGMFPDNFVKVGVTYGRSVALLSFVGKITPLRLLVMPFCCFIPTVCHWIRYSNNFSVADPDPGSSAFLTPGTRDPGWVKMVSGSGMNNPDHIFERLETSFCVKYFNSLM
jgi:hypothetical protein